MTFQQLKILLKVIETGNFTKTGELLNISQSGVSHTITSLENELGEKVLRRDKGKIALTEAGERIIEHIREILYQEELIFQKLQQGKLEKRMIKLATFPSLTMWLTKNILPEIKRKEWNVELSIREGTYEEIENWLRNQEVDLGLTTSSISPSFPYYHLFFDPLYLVVSEKHPLAIKEQVFIEDLAHHNFILPIAGCQKLILSTLRKENVKVKIMMELRETHTILDLVQENTGITILPRMALPQMEGVKYIPIQPLMQREVGVTFALNNKNDPEIKRLFQLLSS